MNRFCFLLIFVFLRASLSLADDSSPEHGKDAKQEGIRWGSVLWQSGLFLGVEHSFRISTEQGTRDGMSGPFIRNYLNSVGNLHGWADGDPFLVNYVGHPMQGAVTGFIMVQNDPRGATLEYGNNALYWKSRLRAFGWAWAYSALFEIGPLSEASLGRVQSYFPQQGFVDQIVTPVIGTSWLLAEDFLDKYVIKRVEDHTENVFVRMMFRGWLNPSRSMANVMRLKVPWYRDTRAGIWSYRHDVPRDPSLAVLAPSVYHSIGEIPVFRLTLRYNYGAGPFSTSCNGGGAEGQFRFTQQVSGIVDVSGCKSRFSNKDLSGDSLNFLAGLRYSRQLTDRWTIYGQALAGGTKMTSEVFLPAIKAVTPSAGEDDWVAHAKYTTSREMTSFATSVGGGAEYTLSNAFALRVGSVDYIHNWTGHSDYMPNDSVRVSTGIVLRLGTW
jgi:opacity protein-like surface antigen